MSLLQLLDEGLDIGRDYFFRGLLLLRLFGVLDGRVDGGFGGSGDGCAVHRWFLLLAVALASAFEWAAACTYMPNASWRRAGGSNCKGRGISHP